MSGAVETREHLDGMRPVLGPLPGGEFIEGPLRRGLADIASIGPDAGHGVEAVDHGKVAGNLGDLLAGEAIRVSLSIPSLVVVPD